MDDLAAACLFLMENYDDAQFINVGCGEELTIRELANLIKDIVGYPGEIVWDTSKPDGSPRKFMDSSRLFALGWKPKVNMREGIQTAYADFLKIRHPAGIAFFRPHFASSDNAASRVLNTRIDFATSSASARNPRLHQQPRRFHRRIVARTEYGDPLQSRLGHIGLSCSCGIPSPPLAIASSFVLKTLDHSRHLQCRRAPGRT